MTKTTMLDDWIVCHGAERPVADRRVVCPALVGARASDIRVDDCHVCRHLVTAAADRTRAFMCSAEWDYGPAPAEDDEVKER